MEQHNWKLYLSVYGAALKTNNHLAKAGVIISCLYPLVSEEEISWCKSSTVKLGRGQAPQSGGG